MSPFRYLSLTIAVLIGLSGCVTVTQDRFAEKASPDKAVENYTQLGLGYLQKGRPDWARDRLQKALEIKPEDPAANDAMGDGDERSCEEIIFFYKLPEVAQKAILAIVLLSVGCASGYAAWFVYNRVQVSKTVP